MSLEELLQKMLMTEHRGVSQPQQKYCLELSDSGCGTALCLAGGLAASRFLLAKANSHPPQNWDHQKRLQTIPNTPWVKPPLRRTALLRVFLLDS